MDSSLRIIFVGLGITKIGKNAVTHITGNITTILFDYPLAVIQVSKVDNAHIFGIKLLGQLRGISQVTKHHC